MKRVYLLVTVLVVAFLSPAIRATPIAHLEQHLHLAVNAQSASQRATALATPDVYGTPLIIQLARQGDVKAILQAKAAASGKFLLVKDAYENNVFHVAKNADTVQALASLLRHFYAGQTSLQITDLVDARNAQGETPLLAQINAGHADTFAPLYAYSTLKQKNDKVKWQLARLRGVNEEIAAPNRAIYCAEIIKQASAGERTLLQAAQAQLPYHPEMAHVTRIISQEMPCLVN